MIQEMRKYDPDCRIAAIADVRPEAARKRLGEPGGPPPRFYERAQDMLDAETLDAVLIGTRCSLHARMAMEVLPRGIPLFLEKPVATTPADWQRLREAADRASAPVVVSFPLRMAKIVQLAKEIVDSGKLGTVEHVQAVNNVPYGGVYYHSWYRDENETGGLFLQKSTHDFDYLQYLLGGVPARLCAVASKQVFKGDKPAGLRCSQCEERDCPERVEGAGDHPDAGDYCCFAEDTGNEDSGSVLLQYESGMHVSYSQNFFARRGAARRGARLLGFKGTLEFDFYTQKLRVDLHHSPRVETYELEASGRHFGGDAALAANFVDVLRGRAEPCASLRDGLLSALICLKAKEAAASFSYQTLDGEARSLAADRHAAAGPATS
jgi:predicted dehydrogenase